MLVLVTRRADLLGCLAQRGVVGLNIAVAARARSGLGRGVLVNVVATHAVGAAVHDYCRGSSLRSRVTAHAVLGFEISMRGRAAGGLARSSVNLRRREFVAVGAIGLGRVAKALRRLDGGVMQATLNFVARRAARRSSCANGLAFQLVALGAGELVLDNVHLVTNRRARALPSRLHVQRRRGLTRIQARGQSRQRNHERGREQGTKRWRHSPWRSISALNR
jgi:hypothetical protein